jgi:hypothetical protein
MPLVPYRNSSSPSRPLIPSLIDQNSCAQSETAKQHWRKSGRPLLRSHLWGLGVVLQCLRDAAMLHCSSITAWEGQMADDKDKSYAEAGCHAPVGSGSRSLKIILVAVHACALLVAPSPVESHAIYSGVYNKEGVPCCDESDCVPAPFRVTPDGVQMLVRGVWISVPPGTFNTVPCRGTRRPIEVTGAVRFTSCRQWA